jgi:phosphate transport system substrate-binding protein
MIMSIHRSKLILAAIISLILLGCQIHLKETQPTDSDQIRNSSRQEFIQSVLELQQKGELSDAQALSIINMMLNPNASKATAIVPKNIHVPEISVQVEPKVSSVETKLVPVPLAALKGRLRSIGSDSMDILMEKALNVFHAQNPALSVRHEGKGSSTAIPSLIEGVAELGPMSRSIKADEIARFEDKFGYPPIQLKVALDALAIYVHPENPILKRGLTMEELDAIFSHTRKAGHSDDVTTWGQLGLTGEWANQPIRVFSRNTASGTYSFFKEHVLKKGDYRENITYLPGSQEIVDAIARDKSAIGYSGIGYSNPSVARVSISPSGAHDYIVPNQENAESGRYPLSRFLYLTINHKSSQTDDSAVIRFVHFLFSDEGSRIVTEAGYFPVSEVQKKTQLEHL